MLKRRSLLLGFVPLPFVLPSLLRQEAERTPAYRVFVPGVGGGQMPDPGYYNMFPSPYMLNRVNTPVLVENTTAETPLFEYEIDPNILSGSHALRLTILGDMLQNGTADAAGSDYTFRLKLGSTMLSTIAFARFQSVTRAPYKYDAMVISTGVGAQLAYAEIPTAISEFDLATAAEDETTALLLSLTVQMEHAHADNEIQLVFAVLELL